MSDDGFGRLADWTTLGVGGPPRRGVVASQTDALVDAVSAADAAGEQVLVLGGGSNVVIADAGFGGTAVAVATKGITVDTSACAGTMLTVAAGERWDDVVALASDEGWVGLEALSGIPGCAGATPIQNVGAYGAEVAQTIARVRTWDRTERTFVTFAAADCGFSYRNSRFKQEPGRYLVVEVTFQLPLGDLSAPVEYGELAASLGVEVGQRAPLAAVRESVLALRASKGMVLDPTDPDTRSAGSFFTNPVLTGEAAATLPTQAPRYRLGGGHFKTSAAWLIEQAGFGKGFSVGGARLSTKHTLAITNPGGASADDILALAHTVAEGVWQRFAVRLEPEPVLVGLEW